MLRLAQETEPRILPYYCLAFFAGLRSNSPELLQLTWDAIHLDEMEIAVPAALAKNRQRRFIKIAPNLAEWIKHFPTRQGRLIRISYGPLQVARAKIFHQVAGQEAIFIKSGMRNTFASNHLAFYNDINRLVLEMGHVSGPQILFNAYHLHTRLADATCFWNIRPQI